MNVSETTPLLGIEEKPRKNNGLSVYFAIICIIDIFGVFPIVTLPKIIIDCGFYGILVIFLVCSVQIYTAILLGRCWIYAEEMFPNMKRKNRYPYSALAEITYGKYLSKFVTFLLDFAVFGGGIPNLIVASQNLQLLGLRLSNGDINISYCYWILITGIILCPVLWLGSPKDMRFVCGFSAVMVTLVFLLTCGCLILNDINTVDGALTNDDSVLWENMFIAYGIITFQFDIHPTILTIQVDMVDKSKLSIAIIGGFLITLCMFGTTTIIASIKYGEAIKSSILEILPSTVPLHFAAALIAIQLCLTSAISNSALYQHMEEYFNISREFNPKRCLLRTILTILAMSLAESVPRFDLVMSLIGGTLTAPLVFILPPLFYIKILSLKTKYEDQLAMDAYNNIVFNDHASSSELSRFMNCKFKADFRSSFSVVERYSKSIFNKRFETGICMFIIIASLFTTLVTTYLNFSSFLSLNSNFTNPCIYNISYSLMSL